MEQEKDSDSTEEDKKLSGSQLRDGITKAKYPHFNPSEQSELIKKIMENARKRVIQNAEQWQHNREAIAKLRTRLLAKGKDRPTWEEIRKEFSINPDSDGYLFKIVDRGLNEFFKKYPNPKMENDIRVLFFSYVLKAVDKTQQDMLDATSVLTNSFGDILSVYQQLGSMVSEVQDINAVSPLHAKRLISFKTEEVTRIVNDMLNILELPVMDAKEAKDKYKKARRTLKENWEIAKERAKKYPQPDYQRHLLFCQKLLHNRDLSFESKRAAEALSREGKLKSSEIQKSSDAFRKWMNDNKFGINTGDLTKAQGKLRKLRKALS